MKVTKPEPQARRPHARRVVLAGAVVLWILVLIIGAEIAVRVYERFREPQLMTMIEAVRAEALSRQKLQVEQLNECAPVPSPGLSPPPDAPPRVSFWGYQTDDARQDFVDKRGELILLCDEHAVVRKLFIPRNPRPIAELASTVSTGTPLVNLLRSRDSTIVDDAVSAIELARTGASQIRDYPLILPDGSDYLTEVYFDRIGASTPGDSEIVAFVRPAIFEIPWFRYRNHLLRSENFVGWTVWTNNVGFRDEDVAIPKPQGIYRIVCIGGSTTFEGPRNDLTYPNLLEQLLRKRFSTENIEVINCGVFGLDSKHELQRFPDYLALEPDLLIHYNFANDAPALLGMAFVSRRNGGLTTLLEHSRLAKALFKERLAPPETDFVSIINEYTMPNLRSMCEEARRHRIPIMFCSFARPDISHLPAKARVYFEGVYDGRLGPSIHAYVNAVDAYNGALRQLCSEMAVCYIPVAERLKGGPELFADHCHLYLDGIQRKANLIFSVVEETVARALPTAKETCERSLP